MAPMGCQIYANETSFKGKSDNQPEIRSSERHRKTNNRKYLKNECIRVSRLTVKGPLSFRKPLQGKRMVRGDLLEKDAGTRETDMLILIVKLQHYACTKSTSLLLLFIVNSAIDHSLLEDYRSLLLVLEY